MFILAYILLLELLHQILHTHISNYRLCLTFPNCNYDVSVFVFFFWYLHLSFWTSNPCSQLYCPFLPCHRKLGTDNPIPLVSIAAVSCVWRRDLLHSSILGRHINFLSHFCYNYPKGLCIGVNIAIFLLICFFDIYRVTFIFLVSRFFSFQHKQRRNAIHV